MGESTRFTSALRVAGVAAAGAALALTLASCSLMPGAGSASSPAATPASTGDVVDPSIPSDTPTPVATATATQPASAAPATTTATPVASTSAGTGEARKKVVPFITSAEWDAKAKEVDVSGIVPSILEQGGTCDVTLTSAGTTRTVAGKAVAASSYTGCETVTFRDLAAGTWTVRIAYSSTKSVGQSAARTVTVG